MTYGRQTAMHKMIFSYDFLLARLVERPSIKFFASCNALAAPLVVSSKGYFSESNYDQKLSQRGRVKSPQLRLAGSE